MRRFGAEGGVCLGAVVVLWQAAPGPAARGCSLGRALGAARVRGAEAGSRPAATRLLLLRPKQPGFALARGGTHGAQPCAWRPKTRRRWQRAVLPNALCDGVTPFKPLPGIRSKPESVRVLARTRWGWDARYGVLSRWGWRGEQVVSVANTTPPTTAGRSRRGVKPQTVRPVRPGATTAYLGWGSPIWMKWVAGADPACAGSSLFRKKRVAVRPALMGAPSRRGHADRAPGCGRSARTG